jgi:hypothetical protein
MNDNVLRDLWLSFQRNHKCSIDRMLCDPELRQAFLSAVRLTRDCSYDEQTILWRLVSLRKRKVVPAQLR